MEGGGGVARPPFGDKHILCSLASHEDHKKMPDATKYWQWALQGPLSQGRGGSARRSAPSNVGALGAVSSGEIRQTQVRAVRHVKSAAAMKRSKAQGRLSILTRALTRGMGVMRVQFPEAKPQQYLPTAAGPRGQKTFQLPGPVRPQWHTNRYVTARP